MFTKFSPNLTVIPSGLYDLIFEIIVSFGFGENTSKSISTSIFIWPVPS